MTKALTAADLAKAKLVVVMPDGSYCHNEQRKITTDGKQFPVLAGTLHGTATHDKEGKPYDRDDD